MTFEHDIVVIGAGMAGAAIAAHLSEHASVRLLEMEDHPGYHSIGRSAALFAESYGNGLVRALTRASRSFFFSPPENFCSEALVKPRSMLATARAGQESALEAFCASAAPGDLVELKSAAPALEPFPLLEPDAFCPADETYRLPHRATARTHCGSVADGVRCRRAVLSEARRRDAAALPVR